MASHAKLQSMVGPGKYDLVLRVERLLDVFDQAKGWKLAVGAQSDTYLEASASVRIAPIGDFNVGKTWLISKLCEGATGVAAGQRLDLDCGDWVHTEGFSVKVCRLGSQECVFLDTAGQNTPVTSVAALGHVVHEFGENKHVAMMQMMQELKRHEDLVKRVAFDFAQVYLVVLGYMNFADQLQIVQLIEQARQAGGTARKDVIIVHNLKDMTYKQFKEDIDPLTGLTYLESIESVFMMRSRQMPVGDRGEFIDELYGAFGDDVDHGCVSMRHVFITYDGPTTMGAAGGPTQADPADPESRNHLVIEYLRKLLQCVTPKTSHIPAELGACMSRCVLSMVRLPPRTDVEVRYDKANRRMIAGSLSAEVRREERGKLQAAVVTTDLVQAQKDADAAQAVVTDAGANVTPAMLNALEAADHKLGEERAKAAGILKCTVPDVSVMKPLPANSRVTTRSVMMGATSMRSNADAIRCSESRVRAYYQDQALWLCKVTMTVPAMKSGEVQRLRDVIQWVEVGGVGVEGAWMEAPSRLQEETLKLRFAVTILNVPEKQLQLLAHAGRPIADVNGKVNGPCITFDAPTPATPMVVFDKGTRPFSNESACDGHDAEVPVEIHTKFQYCVQELQPLVHYGRGLLTVAVLCDLTEDERRDASNDAWISNTDPTAMVVDQWQFGANGTDDDVEE